MSDRYLNFLFVLRSDAGVKGGGDLVQAKFYQQVLEAAFDCKVSFAHELTVEQVRRVEWDVVQLFNISRLHENLMVLAGVHYKKLLLSPILQPGFSFNSKLLVKNILRSLIWKRFSLGAFLKKPETLLQCVDGFVFLSEPEKAAFATSFPGTNTSNSIVFANGVSDGIASGEGVRAFDFIIVGRVEPKKRVVEAIDSVSNVDPRALVVCVGGMNWYHPVYCLKFFCRVLRGRVLYLGKRSPSVVYDFMRMTRTLLNFSELEVSPLVDLEALACGCNVVSTTCSYSHLPASDQFERIDVKNSEVCARAVEMALTSSQVGVVKVNTWSENSAAYLKLVGGLIERNRADGVLACVVP